MMSLVRSEFLQVFYNNTDREYALSKIAFIQQYWTGIEFVGIGIPNTVNPFRPNPNPGITSVPATPLNNRPHQAPFLVNDNQARLTTKWTGTNTLCSDVGGDLNSISY